MLDWRRRPESDWRRLTRHRREMRPVSWATCLAQAEYFAQQWSNDWKKNKGFEQKIEVPLPQNAIVAWCSTRCGKIFANIRKIFMQNTACLLCSGVRWVLVRSRVQGDICSDRLTASLTPMSLLSPPPPCRNRGEYFVKWILSRAICKDNLSKKMRLHHFNKLMEVMDKRYRKCLVHIIS